MATCTSILTKVEKSARYCPVVIGLAFYFCLAVHLFAAGAVNVYPHKQQSQSQSFLDAFSPPNSAATKTFCALQGTGQRRHVEVLVRRVDTILTLAMVRPVGHRMCNLLLPGATMTFDRVGW